MAVARTYLDHNATAPLRIEAREAMVAALDLVGNPSSVHFEGRDASRAIETARRDVARYIGADPREIVFTSGATESNNWVICAPWSAVVTSRVEHDSVLVPALSGAAPSHIVGVGGDGLVDLSALEEVLGSLLERVSDEDRDIAPPVGSGNNADDAVKVLVSIQAANGETGVVQAFGDVRQVLDRYRGVLLHVDAVQLRGCHFDVLDLARADFVSLSAHKIGGPKGIGALYVRAGLSLPPMMVGGGQEVRRRSGTQNVGAIAGFGAACAAALDDRRGSMADSMRALRDELEQGAVSAVDGAFVVAGESGRLCNTACVCVPGVRAETLVMALDLEGIAVSSGSACSSGKVAKSHVLNAMGFGGDESGSAVRISLGPDTTRTDVMRFLSAWRLVTGRVLERKDCSSEVRKRIA